MPAEAALTNPNGNGPQDIASPVPGAGQTIPAPPPIPATQAAPAQAAQPSPPQQPQGQGNPFLVAKTLSQEQNQPSFDKNPFLEKDPNFPSGYMPVSPRLRRTPTGGL